MSEREEERDKERVVLIKTKGTRKNSSTFLSFLVRVYNLKLIEVQTEIDRVSLKMKKRRRGREKGK